jgi:hypothetical protein
MTTLSWSNRKRRSISPVAKALKKGWPVCVRGRAGATRAVVNPSAGDPGAASKVEVLRLERQKNELENKITEMKNQYYVRAREELAKANAEIEAQRSVMKGRETP